MLRRRECLTGQTMTWVTSPAGLRPSCPAGSRSPQLRTRFHAGAGAPGDPAAAGGTQTDCRAAEAAAWPSDGIGVADEAQGPAPLSSPATAPGPGRRTTIADLLVLPPPNRRLRLWAAAWARVPQPMFNEEVRLGFRLSRELGLRTGPWRPPGGFRTAVRNLTRARTTAELERAAFGAVVWAAGGPDQLRTRLGHHMERRLAVWLWLDPKRGLRPLVPYTVRRFLSLGRRPVRPPSDRPLRRPVRAAAPERGAQAGVEPLQWW